MCGIVGYIGMDQSAEILLSGLQRLEYRGYDSSGVAVIGENGKMRVVRRKGKIASLRELLDGSPLEGSIGIAHTRWATHGKPSDENAHPHTGGPFAVVHNGIIENYAELKSGLEAEGYRFGSQTDTEVVAKLAEREWDRGNDFRQSVLNALKQVRGSYAVVFLNRNHPEEMIAARMESPLILGMGKDAFFLASDVPAILPYTKKVVYLEDGDMVHLRREGWSVDPLNGRGCTPLPHTIAWDSQLVEKKGYRHFMLKEIHEQPAAIRDTFRSVVDPRTHELKLDQLELDSGLARRIGKIFLVACGTSYHAGMVGKYILERIARVPVEVDLASEFRYRDPLLDENTLLVAISQSGETADTRAALREGMDKGAVCRGIVNVVGSSIARMCGGVIHTHAGPEIGVASTKAFTTQLIALYLLALQIGLERGALSKDELSVHLEELTGLPAKVEQALADSDRISEWAKEFHTARDFLYLGRGLLYPVALEGALKLKEISYIHAEGYAAGEMKHGPIALIDHEMPVVTLLREGPLYEKTLSNLEEVKAREGRVLALAQGQADPRIGPAGEQLILPASSDLLSPVLFTIPLQLLAYHIAVLRGTDVDQPRNLAKSVTVE